MTAAALTLDTIRPDTAAVLFRFLALREDGPAGVCWAWVDSADCVCSKPEDPGTPHLCGRHAKVALARGLREVERKAARTMTAERRAMIEYRMAANELALSDVVGRLARLTGAGSGHLDHGILNTPLRGRMITDAQLDKWRALDSRRSDLAARVSLDQSRLKSGRG